MAFSLYLLGFFIVGDTLIPSMTNSNPLCLTLFNLLELFSRLTFFFYFKNQLKLVYDEVSVLFVCFCFRREKSPIKWLLNF